MMDPASLAKRVAGEQVQPAADTGLGRQEAQARQEGKDTMPGETLPPRPIPDSYWVEPGRLLAGEYPGSRHEGEARRKLRRLLDAGVTFFLDLTEAGEYGLKPYAPLLAEDDVRRGRSVVHRRMAIPDGGTPSTAEMRHILDTLDAAPQEGHTVYVHCWGGIGRTGTVVGCYLVRHGLSGREALDLIARRRAGTPDGYRRSPETRAQMRLILDWPAGG